MAGNSGTKSSSKGGRGGDTSNKPQAQNLGMGSAGGGIGGLLGGFFGNGTTRNGGSGAATSSPKGMGGGAGIGTAGRGIPSQSAGPDSITQAALGAGLANAPRMSTGPVSRGDMGATARMTAAIGGGNAHDAVGAITRAVGAQGIPQTVRDQHPDLAHDFARVDQQLGIQGPQTAPAAFDANTPQAGKLGMFARPSDAALTGYNPAAGVGAQLGAVPQGGAYQTATKRMDKFNYERDPNRSPQDSIRYAAAQLGIPAHDLATAMSYETAGSMSPKKMGGVLKDGKYQNMGLIQFGPAEQKKYGVSTNQSFDDQAASAAHFLYDRGVTPGMDFTNVYSTINAGSPGRLNASDAANGGMPGTVKDKAYSKEMNEHRAAAQRFMDKAPAASGVAMAPQLGAGYNYAPMPSVGAAAPVAGGVAAKNTGTFNPAPAITRAAQGSAQNEAMSQVAGGNAMQGSMAAAGAQPMKDSNPFHAIGNALGISKPAIAGGTGALGGALGGIGKLFGGIGGGAQGAGGGGEDFASASAKFAKPAAPVGGQAPSLADRANDLGNRLNAGIGSMFGPASAFSSQRPVDNFGSGRGGGGAPINPDYYNQVANRSQPPQTYNAFAAPQIGQAQVNPIHPALAARVPWLYGN